MQRNGAADALQRLFELEPEEDLCEHGTRSPTTSTSSLGCSGGRSSAVRLTVGIFAVERSSSPSVRAAGRKETVALLASDEDERRRLAGRARLPFCVNRSPLTSRYNCRPEVAGRKLLRAVVARRSGGRHSCTPLSNPPEGAL
jgi:hypothetical protein